MLQETKISDRASKLLLGLLHEIFLEKLPDAAAYAQFFVAFDDGYPGPFSGPGIEWWLSKRYQRVERALAKAICEQFRSTTALTLDDAAAAIKATLRDNRLNRAVLLAGKPRTLFDAYGIEKPTDVVTMLWFRILRELRARIDDWLFVYPLKNLSAPTNTFCSINASIVSSNDRSVVEECCLTFPG